MTFARAGSAASSVGGTRPSYWRTPGSPPRPPAPEGRKLRGKTRSGPEPARSGRARRPPPSAGARVRAAARPGCDLAGTIARPPRPPTSSSRTPLRASRNLMRIAAPFPSSISLPQLSETSTVFRASFLLRYRGVPISLARKSDVESRPPRARSNSPRTKQAEQRLLLEVEPGIARLRRRANGEAENRRSFGRRDTARSPPG